MSSSIIYISKSKWQRNIVQRCANCNPMKAKAKDRIWAAFCEIFETQSILELVEKGVERKMFHLTGVYRRTGHFLYQRYLLIISRSYVAVFLRLSFWLLWQQLYWQSIYPCDGEGVAESPKPQLKYRCGTKQWAAYTYILVSDRNTITHTHCTSSQIHIHKYKYTNTNTPKTATEILLRDWVLRNARVSETSAVCGKQ